MTNFVLTEDGVRVSTHETVEEAAERLVEDQAYGRYEIRPTVGESLTMVEDRRYSQIVGDGFRRELERRKIARQA